ncbi:MAG TPA: acyloxyacyl hydrolase [Chitinophagaceae bacterium]|nr:acyloxyacyl hydrolase [Chitinophagaceae bacterium]
MSKKSRGSTIRSTVLFIFLTLLQSARISAQDKRAQIPGILANTYINISVGYIGYNFTNTQMETGFQASAIQIPHPSVRLAMDLHRFNKNLITQLTYMRPVNWIQYKNVNGDRKSHSVWMNMLGLSMKYMIPFSKNFSAYAEGGIANITRNGFRIGNTDAIKTAEFVSVSLGTGLQYHLNSVWDFTFNSVWAPSNGKHKQPQMFFIGGGVIYNTHQLSPEKLERDSKSGYIFPKNIFQVGYANSVTGYSVNKFVAEGAVPVFWSGDVHVRQGLMFHFQHNVFHTRKIFSMDWGTSLSLWQSKKNKDFFFTVSAYPLFRFTPIRTKPFDLYFVYSLAGPSFISRIVIDGNEAGKHFTFQDFMGIGIFTGKKRNINAEIKIGHYSNGNLFPVNSGIDFPLGLSIGRTF